jgi:hypothetical protein
MTVYLKDDFDFDFGMFLSKISMINLKVSNTIEKFADSLAEIDKESTMDIEIIEDLGSTTIPDDLAKVLFNLTDDLKNQIFFNLLAVSIFSFLEFSLIEYCRLIDSYIEPEKPYGEYRNFGLDKAKDYIKDNFNIDFGTVANWEEINKFQRVRNLIVHNNANIIKDYDKPIEGQDDYIVLSGMKGTIEITSSGTIFIKTIEYITEIQEKSVALINDIIEKTKGEVVKHEKTPEQTN